jgi:hypothetical protein
MLQNYAFGQKKSNFMQGFKSALLEKLKNCQNGTFETVHEIRNFFLAKSILLKHYENYNKKNIRNLSQGPPNQGFMQGNVQKGNFLKKPSARIEKLFLF